MHTIIEVENVKFSYGGPLILDNVRFTINSGDFAAIIGANGTGKSTLLKLLLGEIMPQSGSIRLLGTDVQKFKAWPKIGYVPQNHMAVSAGFPATALEVVQANLFSAIGLFRLTGQKHRALAMDALELVGMQEHARALIGNLSGGQQQRVMIARALVAEPSVMLLDEPTTGVDSAATTGLYALLQKLNRERALSIVMVTHDIARAAPYLTRTLCLEEGTIVELEKSQLAHELEHKHKHPARPADAAEGADKLDS